MAMGQHLTVVVALIQLFCNDCSPVHNCPATDLTIASHYLKQKKQPPYMYTYLQSTKGTSDLEGNQLIWEDDPALQLMDLNGVQL